MNEMNITNAQYVLSVDGSDDRNIKATVDGVELHIPISPANRHYAEIMRQVDAGTLTIEDAD